MLHMPEGIYHLLRNFGVAILLHFFCNFGPKCWILVCYMEMFPWGLHWAWGPFGFLLSYALLFEDW